jgi:hypothetical protein
MAIRAAASCRAEVVVANTAPDIGASATVSQFENIEGDHPT